MLLDSLVYQYQNEAEVGPIQIDTVEGRAAWLNFGTATKPEN
jgi:hypothetical protein